MCPNLQSTLSNHIILDFVDNLYSDNENVENLMHDLNILMDNRNGIYIDNRNDLYMFDEYDKRLPESSRSIIPATPSWISQQPLDPRCVIKTIFADIDERIPDIEIPRMDFKPIRRTGLNIDNGKIVQRDLSTSKIYDNSSKYKCRRTYSTCWICHSDKSEFRKFVLHRHFAKRQHRNWKKEVRYIKRSKVANSRVRDNGKFVRMFHWV